MKYSSEGKLVSATNSSGRAFKILIFITVLTAPVAAKGFASQEARPAPPTNVSPSSQSQSQEVVLIARDAQEALKREDWEGAIRGFEKLVKISPSAAEYHLNLGIAHYSSGRPQDATRALRQALKLKPSLTRARDYLGASLAESGQCKEALPYLRRDVSRVTDRNLTRAVGLGGVKCAMALNRPDEALDFVRLLNHDFPSDPEVLYLSTHVYSDLSVKASQDLLYKAPSSYQVHLLNAEALETQEKWDDAAYEYRQVLAKNPNLPGIHYRLGRLLLSAPKKATTMEEARREFEQELKIDPRNAGAEYVLGELARQARQWPQAIEHFSRATKLDASFADAFIGLGKSLVSAGRGPEALAPLEAAVRLQPENPVAHFQLATAYRRSGRAAEAEKEFAAHKQASEKARQTTEGIQAGILGPQKAEPPE